MWKTVSWDILYLSLFRFQKNNPYYVYAINFIPFSEFYEKVVALKEKGVKVVLGLGGWDDSASDKYSRMVNSPSARRKFVIHALDFIEQYEFDGLDLDWEYPKCWQVSVMVLYLSENQAIYPGNPVVFWQFS